MEKKSWLPLRKNIADLHRRAEVSQAANNRYLDALSVVDLPVPVKSLVEDIVKPTTLKGHRVRAINPWNEDDFALLEAIMKGQYILRGFRNRDLRQILLGDTKDLKEQKKQSAKISRKLRMLRAHGLINKVSHTYKYQVTKNGVSIVSALMAARNADANQLTKLAA